MNTFTSFVIKEGRHILRDRQTLTVLLLLPILMVLLFGFAIRTDVQDLRTVVVDPSRDARSADLTQAVASTDALYFVGVRPSVEDIEALFRRGAADVALVLPVNFAERVAAGTAEVLIVSDGINANYAAAAETYVRAIVDGWAARNGAGPPHIRVDARMRFNPTLQSEVLFIPGLLAFVLTLVSALMTAISIAREKETGTLELLLVSPLRPLQIVVGKVAPYLVLAFVNVITALAVARLIFDVPFRGSLAFFLLASLVYVLAALAVGVLISSRAPNQRTAMIATLLALLIPTLALTGFIFPISSMPVWLQPFTNVVPATWYISIARGVMLKGVGLEILWREFAVISFIALLLLTVAARSFKDRLD